MRDRADLVERLFERHHLSLYRFLLRSTRHPEDAQDLTQEVFLRVLRGVNGYEARGLERAWLFRIARNLLTDRRRRQAGSLRTSVDGDGDEPRTEPTTVDAVALDQALRALTELEREAVILRDIVGLSYVEIAEATECSIDAVAARLYRARANLRNLLTEGSRHSGSGAQR